LDRIAQRYAQLDEALERLESLMDEYEPPREPAAEEGEFESPRKPR
jgi:hypothetical protein